RASRRVDEQFRQRLREQAQKASLFKNLDFQEVEDPDADDAPRGPWRRLEVLLEQSGLNLTPGRLLAAMAGAGLALGAVGLLFRGSPVAGAAGGLVGAALPWLYVHLKR